MEDVYVRYLTSHSQGRLATVGPDGGPQNKPVGYRYNAELIRIRPRRLVGWNVDPAPAYAP